MLFIFYIIIYIFILYLNLYCIFKTQYIDFKPFYILMISKAYSYLKSGLFCILTLYKTTFLYDFMAILYIQFKNNITILLHITTLLQMLQNYYIFLRPKITFYTLKIPYKKFQKSSSNSLEEGFISYYLIKILKLFIILVFSFI